MTSPDIGKETDIVKKKSGGLLDNVRRKLGGALVVIVPSILKKGELQNLEIDRDLELKWRKIIGMINSGSPNKIYDYLKDLTVSNSNIRLIELLMVLPPETQKRLDQLLLDYIQYYRRERTMISNNVQIEQNLKFLETVITPKVNFLRAIVSRETVSFASFSTEKGFDAYLQVQETAQVVEIHREGTQVDHYQRYILTVATLTEIKIDIKTKDDFTIRLESLNIQVKILKQKIVNLKQLDPVRDVLISDYSQLIAKCQNLLGIGKSKGFYSDSIYNPDYLDESEFFESSSQTHSESSQPAQKLSKELIDLLQYFKLDPSKRPSVEEARTAYIFFMKQNHPDKIRSQDSKEVVNAATSKTQEIAAFYAQLLEYIKS